MPCSHRGSWPLGGATCRQHVTDTLFLMEKRQVRREASLQGLKTIGNFRAGGAPGRLLRRVARDRRAHVVRSVYRQNLHGLALGSRSNSAMALPLLMASRSALEMCW